ncbi:MAG: N-6 DNA methylase [Chthonomonadetes bacterium]|nr:N-6 DNA methylase [Chthonomonadetes bacterium]
MQLQQVQSALSQCHRPGEIAQLLKVLGYPLTEPTIWDVSDLPESARAKLRQVYLLSTVEDEHGIFRVYHLEMTSFKRADLRTVIEPFYRCHPQGNYLFVATTDDPANILLISPRRIFLQDAGKVKLLLRTLSVNPSAPFRTDLEILAAIAATPGEKAEQIWRKHEDAFSIERVTQKFFKEYRNRFEKAESLIQGINGDERRIFTQKLFNRLLFIRFLERKGWLRFGGSPDYLRALWQNYQKNGGGEFYRERVKPLFFTALNTPHDVNVVGINRGGYLQNLLGEVPYLNGGLFEQDDLDRRDDIVVPDEAVEPVINELLYRFNFTITESSPLDVEVAVDPEMLGKVFEELVTGRHETGSYYTPRPVVAFMCREALKGYLCDACPQEDVESINVFVEERDATNLRDPEKVLDALKQTKVCDPACGSGAYLLGMLHELLDLRQCLFQQKRLGPATVYQRKLEIIQNNLYGVDIDPFAVNIARLRLWLSLVVDDERNPLDDQSVDVALPNLDFKIEVGDSLLAPDPQGGVQPDMFRAEQIDRFDRLKGEYLRVHAYGEKEALRKEIEELREEIRQWAHPGNQISGFDWRVEFAEVFKRGGFDIILANPPYVRQELIPNKPALLKQYEDVAEGRSDLYVYFYARALQLLRQGGVHVFVCSNSWLDVGFGGKLQKYLLEHSHIQAIYDSAVERQFASADVNTIISILRKGRPADNARTRFIRLHSAFESAIADPSQQRVIEKTREELWQEGLDDEGRYVGNKWGGKYLRAPDIYFTILEKGQRYRVLQWSGEPVIVEDITDSLED